MTTLTITAKGQVTFKHSLIKHLGVSPGQKIEVDMLPDARLIVTAARQNGTISDFIGCLAQQDTPSLPIDEINEIVAEGWTGEK